MADYQSLDIRRRSASTESAPDVRGAIEVAKLIDVSKCIGCKACQAACMEWNDLRDADRREYRGLSKPGGSRFQNLDPDAGSRNMRIRTAIWNG